MSSSGHHAPAHTHTYTVSIKTESDDCAHYVEMEKNGFVLAEENTSFYLELRNNSTVDRCDASVTIGKEYIGTWAINPGSRVFVRETDKRKMCFDGVSFYDVASFVKKADMMDNSSITVVFLPICANKQRCAPIEQLDGSTTIVCYSDIQWSKMVTIKTPVLLRRTLER